MTCRASVTPTGTTRVCCARTAGAPSRTPRPTSSLHLRPGIRILDVGCGPGTITAELADRVGADGAVVGIDASADVVAQASGTMARDNLTYAVGDVYALDADDNTFDVVHAHQVLQHLADPVAALTEMRRVCRPGGLVAARDSDYQAMSWHPQPPELREWLELYMAITRANGGNPDAGRLLLSWAQRAGFTDISSSASVVVLRDAVRA